MSSVLISKRDIVLPVSKQDKNAPWQKDITILIQKFVESTNSLYQTKLPPLFVDDRSLSRVWFVYKQERNKFKKENFGQTDNKQLIDHHKIIAIYIKAFLCCMPIMVNVNTTSQVKDLSDDHLKDAIKFANEFFCMKLMETILRGWVDYDNKERLEKKLDFDEERQEKKWFLILLNHYRYRLRALDILSLSQNIYYIEKSSFK